MPFPSRSKLNILNRKTLFFTGGWCRIHNYNHGEHAKELALARGVPLEAIVFDDASVTSTYMEVERLREWIAHRPAPIHSVVVVSDPFHMRRARWAYRRVLKDSLELQMAPVPFELTFTGLRLISGVSSSKKSLCSNWKREGIKLDGNCSTATS